MIRWHFRADIMPPCCLTSLYAIHRISEDFVPIIIINAIWLSKYDNHMLSLYIGNAHWASFVRTIHVDSTKSKGKFKLNLHLETTTVPLHLQQTFFFHKYYKFKHPSNLHRIQHVVWPNCQFCIKNFAEIVFINNNMNIGTYQEDIVKHKCKIIDVSSVNALWVQFIFVRIFFRYQSTINLNGLRWWERFYLVSFFTFFWWTGFVSFLSLWIANYASIQSRKYWSIYLVQFSKMIINYSAIK